MNQDSVAEAGVFSEPPDVTVKERTHCEVCGEKLDPNASHVCEGNVRFHTPKSDGGFLDDPPPQVILPDLTHYHGVCPQCHGAPAQPGEPAEPCSVCNGTGVIP